MFDKFVADLLTTYLGEYFDNIDREQVKVSVWNGRVHLRELKVRRDALRFLDVPICVLMGTIEELTVVIPWTHLRSEPVVLQIRNARLILADKETALYDVDQEKLEERLRKARELKASDEALLATFKGAQRTQQKQSSAPSAEASTEGDDSNFAARLKAGILNNIRVEVERLCVHYTSHLACATCTHEDDVDTTATANEASSHCSNSSPHHDAPSPASTDKMQRQVSLSFQIQEVKTCGCNEHFEPAFVAPGEHLCRQRVAFRGLAVSLRTGAEKATEVPLIHPFNISLELAYQPVVTDPTTPQYMLALRMDESCACVLTSESCTTCYNLLHHLRCVRARQVLRRLRPIGVRPTAKPQLWWRYVIDAVRQQLRNVKTSSLASAHKLTPFSWLTYTTTKTKRDRYMGLYLRRQRVALGATRWLEPLHVQEDAEMANLEEELSIEMMKLAKRLAMERATVERIEYEKLVRQKKASSAAYPPASSLPAKSTTEFSAAVESSPASGSTSGWFSFWRSSPQPTQSSGGGNVDTKGAPADGLDDTARAELRELVQLMTAEKWTDAQRAIIAQEFGMSAEEARVIAQSGTTNTGFGSDSGSSSTAVVSGVESLSTLWSGADTRHGAHAAPAWILFASAVSVSLELRSCAAEARALHEPSPTATPPTQDTLAKLVLGKLQGGAEWSSGAADAALPHAYYWGCVELFIIAAAKLDKETQQQQEEQVLVKLQQPEAACATNTPAGAHASTSQFAAHTSTSDAALKRTREIPPLEACWTTLPDECRRGAAWQFDWTQRSPQQLASRTAAVHRVSIRLAPLHLVVDAVPLRNLASFFFTVMWPTAVTAQSHVSASPATSDLTRSATSVNVAAQPATSSSTPTESFLTSLLMPTSPNLTHVEQRCATDAEARLLILRRKVERQYSIEWNVLMDAVTVSLSEIPEVQGCELTIKNLVMHNDAVHRLQRQARLHSESSKKEAVENVAAPPAVFGSEVADWFDYTHVEAEATSLNVFVASTSAAGIEQHRRETASTALPVVRRLIFAETPITMEVERSLLGRCCPEKPLYKLRVSARSTVQLSWSRSSLSALTTLCSTLRDLVASVGEALVRRGSASSTSTTTTELSSSETFHVDVVPHLTGKALWRNTGQTARDSVENQEGASDNLNNPDVHYRQMHPFSASRLAATTGTSASTRRTTSAKRRVSIRSGVCVLYHPQRPSFPAEYYSLQRDCVRIRRTETKGADDSFSAYFLHLYVLQGGANQEDVFTDAYDAAERLLVDTVGVPQALLQNAVWLESAVDAWIANTAREHEAHASEKSSDFASTASDLPSTTQVLQALALVLKKTHVVPCRYVAFQCADANEAQLMEEALLRCCVAPSTPPLELTPAVKAQYNAVVDAPRLRKQLLWSAQLDFSSLQMTCEGREPAACCDVLPQSPSNFETSPRSARRDAVLVITPLSLRVDRYAEKQRFELAAPNTMEMYSCIPRSESSSSTNNAQDTSAKQLLLRIAPSAALSSQPPPSSSATSAAPLFLRFVAYYRPQPLPSMKRCGIHVGPASTVKVHVGPAMFEWAEAWWDSVRLLANHLFSEEVIVGYPWWAPSPTEPFEKPREIATAWCSEEDYGGNTPSMMVDLISAAVEVEVELPSSRDTISTEMQPLCVPQACSAFRLAARDASLQWRLTEALNQVHVDVANPSMQWRREALTNGTDSSEVWVTVMSSQAVVAVAGSSSLSGGAGLSLDWKLHKPPPMLSASDWLCCGNSSNNNAFSGNDEERLARPSIGFRDRQELAVELCCLTLLYWHPLLLSLIQSFQDGVLSRAITLVKREPCWFHDGVLYCPPLAWPHSSVPPTTEISWDRLCKSVALRHVVLHLPEDVNWMEKAGGGAPIACACEIALGALTYSDCLFAEPATAPIVSSITSPPRQSTSSGSTVPIASTQRSGWASVKQVHSISLHEMSFQRHHSSAALSTAFAASFPSWAITLTFPVYQTSSLWKAKETWQKIFNVRLRSPTGGEPDKPAGGKATWEGTAADLQYALDSIHANYAAGSSAGTDVSTQRQQQPAQGAEVDAMDKGRVDTSPASLLKPVVETTTWELDVESCFEARLISMVSRISSCSAELAGARAVMGHSPAGELSCSLDARHLVFGSGAQPSSSNEASQADAGSGVVPLLRFPAVSPSASFLSAPALLRMQYGWRWLANSTTERALYATLDAPRGASVTADCLAVGRAQSILQCPSLRRIVGRYTAPVASGGPAAEAQAIKSWQTATVKLQLAQLDFQLPCFASCGRGHTSTFSPGNLQLCATFSDVLIRLCKKATGWRGVLRMGHLVRCVLCDHRDVAAPLAIPLLLEQPSEWTQPIESSLRTSWRAQPSPLPTTQRAQTMDASTPAQQSVMDELFGGLPSVVSTAPPPGTSMTNTELEARVVPSSAPSVSTFLSQPGVQEPPLAPMSVPSTENFFVAQLTRNSAKSTFTAALNPLWLLTPSMSRLSLLLSGLCQQMYGISAIFRQTETSSPSLPSPMTTALGGAVAGDVRVGAVSVFILQEEVTVGALDWTARQVEDAVKQALRSEALLVAIEATLFQWDSELAEKCNRNFQTILHLHNTSACALRGLQQCAVLLERFNADVTRQLKLSGGDAPLVEWKLSLDPLQLSLMQLHYTALLRVALQQTSLLAELINSASTASHTSMSAAKPGEEARRRLRLQLASLSLRVEEDGEGTGSAARAGALTAVYVKLKELDVSYYSGKGSVSVVEQKGGNAGGQLRFAVSLHSCLVGKEGAIPTFSLAALSSPSHTDVSSTHSAPSCELRVTEDSATKAKSGVVRVRQVTVTVEAVPVMAWVDLLYAPYLQVVVPNYQTSKELVMQRDLWLTEDLVLTKRAPLRAINKSYSLLYLYGNGHTIYLNAARRGQLIFLDEGMTLRIMHATVHMLAESIEAYVSAGNGSYVVLDRETCKVERPLDSAAEAQQASDDPLLFAGQEDKQLKSLPSQERSSIGKWTEFEGDMEVEVRIPEPRTAFAVSPASPTLTAEPDAAVTANPAITGAQRTLVLYSDMHLSLINVASSIQDISEVSGFFALAHAGARTEFVTPQGVTVHTADLITDWATTVQYTEEKGYAEGGGEDFSADSHANSSRTRPLFVPRCVQHLRNVRLDASSGIEMRVHYSDVFFVLRSARHAQAVFAKWKDAMRRDVWSSLSALPQSWDVEEVEDNQVKEMLMQKRSPATLCSRTTSNFAAAAPPAGAVTRTCFDVRIPYMSFIAVDDSKSTDIPLFCLYVNEIRTPSVVVESPHVAAELQFTLQLDYYGIAKSQWAPVLDPLKFNLALSWRQNTNILDVYNRQGFVRLAVQTGSVKLFVTLELLRNLRQLQLLRAKFEEVGLETFKGAASATRASTSATTEESPSTSSSPFHAFSLLQTTGLEITARLPQCVPNALFGSKEGSSASRVLESGEPWAFNLPRLQGKELPREQQKILVQQHITCSRNAPTVDEPRGAVVSVASVGIQRVPLSTSGPLQRYIVADVSVPLQQAGRKNIHLHSTIRFQNKLSVDIVQVAMNERGTYDTLGVVPAGAATYVSVGVLRRRVCLALSKHAVAASKHPQSYALHPDSLVALGVSYDALPSLVKHTFLCVSAAASSGETGVAAAARHARLAKGKGFDIYSGETGKSYFLMQVQAAAKQPLDVRRYPALAPLRAVTVVAEAAVTIHNAVGLPLTLTLLTRRVLPGVRMGLLDTAPDTAVYTVVHTTTLNANASYGATEMDPLDGVWVSVALQQPNGNALLQWSSQMMESRGGTTENGGATAYYPPVCVYWPGERARRDGQLVLVDPATGATLVLYIKYTKRLVTLYCPYWIINETQLPLQFADTSSPHAGVTDRCGKPIAGLGGRTVRSATVAPWDEATEVRQSNALLGVDEPNPCAHVHLYNSLRSESCSRNKSNASDNGLFVRAWEADSSDSSEPARFSDWSQEALSIHETAEAQVVTCASRRIRGKLLVLSCCVELGTQTSLHAYSDTHVIYIRPRWVLMNKSPYTLCFSHSLPAGVRRGESDAALVRVNAFSEAIVTSIVAAAAVDQNGRPNPPLFFTISDDAQHNIQKCHWSSSVSINVVHEHSINLVHHSLIPLGEYWPQNSAEMSQRGKSAAPELPDSLPPLHPEDIKELNGELFVDREETKVLTTTVYAYKGCMMCVEVDEAPQPPIVVENRTLYTVCFQQRGGRRVSTVFPRCRKAWTWDATPSDSSTPAVLELWLVREPDAPISVGGGATGASHVRGSPAARASCVLNFDPQLIDQQRNSNGFQQEIDVEDPAHGTSTLLFVRVRGVHGMSYAVSITTEPTIDAYRTLPYPQLSLSLQVENVLALLCSEDEQNVLLCAIESLSFSFAQGVRRGRGGARSSGTAANVEGTGTDVQCLQLRFSSLQVDDERPAAKERVVAQLVDDRESGFIIERKLLRTTPVLCYSTVAVRLVPVELHIEDGFITAMMGYQEVIRNTWDSAWPMSKPEKRPTALSRVAGISCPPWKSELITALTQARHAYAELEDNSANSSNCGGGIAAHGSHSRHLSASLWSRLVAIEQLYVDPILVSLSLYRSPGAADDPLWKAAGAASLLIGSTQDARLQWDAVQRRRVCDTIWHLFFVHRDAYVEQMKKQYMSLVNVMGLGTMRNFVSDLLSAYSDDPRSRRDGSGSESRAAERRQKPRVPLRRNPKFRLDQPQSKRACGPCPGGAATVNHGHSSATARSLDAEAEAEPVCATAVWLQQVENRQVAVNAQQTVTISELARSYPWSAFISVAQAAELRAFGGLALARSIADMEATPRYTQTASDGTGRRRVSAQEIVVGVKRRAGAAHVHCTRCVELEALRLKCMREGAATPLPHPIRDGFITWEEFAHHINWYEFVDMCSDDEVCTYASLVRAGAHEASSNVCIITLN
ncbi:hypothetical protein ABL78_3424 [Leptomonas seymouri]|uniref:Chorein N-terminal domain-containing protein n=1 Tax=Leptomonas seymouri TaxID=5684 RepID=A0A0N1PDL3_LEPSE|nr:hypothetical protein ABL78_3424 [Leptomonas seymouri]|eukprot:KPI87475.1 hypothetical protein ABL78_3424 [Leptomonas seymouri]